MMWCSFAIARCQTWCAEWYLLDDLLAKQFDGKSQRLLDSHCFSDISIKYLVRGMQTLSRLLACRTTCSSAATNCKAC